MLGEIIGEEWGKITGTRVLPNGKVEVSFQASGKLLGVEENSMVTYEAVARSDGTMFGEGQGVAMTQDGEMIAWTGQGVGRPTGRGMGASWRASLYYQTTSQKLARLNGVVAIIEFEVDENGNTHGKAWEWK